MSLMTMRRQLLAVSAGLLTTPAVAQSAWPGGQAVTIVMPYTAGGLVTLLGNIMTQGLTQRLGGTFVLDFRPGGSTAIGARHVARARPDGRTLIMGSVTTFAVLPFSVRNLGYDPLRDFDHVTMIGNTLFVLAGNTRWGSLEEVVAQARRQPGGLSYASFGVASTPHLVMLDFLRRAGLDMLHVPFGGSGPAITEILAGRVDLMFSTLASAKPHLEAGRLRAYGIPSATRAQGLPAIPTFTELGYPGFTFDAWLSVAGPAGVPPDVLAALEAALGDIFAEAATRERLAGVGIQPSLPGALAVRENLQRALVHNRDLMDRAGIVPD